MSSRRDLVWIENIRVWAMFTVVFAHCATDYVFAYPNIDMDQWWAGNVYDSLARWSVPNFLMISGYLLLGRSVSIPDLFSKRLLKILIPTVAWSLIYVFWRVYVDKWDPSVWPLLKNLLLVPSYYHLWFLYTLIGLYLVLPLFSAFVRAENEQTIFYLVMVWFLFTCILPIIETSFGIQVGLEVPGATGYIGFFLMGYLMGKKDYSRHDLILAAGVFILCVGLTAYLTFHQSQPVDYVVETFYGNFSPTVMIMSVASFVLIKGISVRVDFSTGVLAYSPKMGVLTFGIYLIHPLWIAAVSYSPVDSFFEPEFMHPWLSIPLRGTLVFMLSVASIWVLQKIPVVNKLVP